MTNAVQIVKIAKKSPLFKKGTGEAANAIELINFSFLDGNECGFNVVSQKDLYQINDLAVYIQPDYCIPNSELFNSFHAPGGDPKKSKLGKKGRIRAIKFNFSLEIDCPVVYSNGILLPLSEANIPENTEDLAEFLGVTKYEEPESFGTGNAKGSLPYFLYQTHEENVANLKSHVNWLLQSGERIGWTLKIDGSSFSQYFRKGENGFYTGICSRTIEKDIPEDLSNTSDSWIRLSISTGLYEKGMEYCERTGRELVFRGEIYGEGVTKGSGNKINPHSKDKPNLAIYGVDDLASGYAVRLLPKEVEEICKKIGVNYLPYEEMLEVNSYERLMGRASNLFTYFEKSKDQVIEGIVVRTLNNNKLSAKIMNPIYDSKK